MFTEYFFNYDFKMFDVLIENVDRANKKYKRVILLLK